jgi:putative acetyltransferase
MKIRSATNADAKKIRELVFAVLAEYGLKGDPDGTDADLNDIEANYFANGGLFEVVENEEGKLIGTVGLYAKADRVCELRKMYLLAETRGKGLGKQLMARVIEQARARGFRRIELETASPLIEAIALYTRFGFHRVECAHLASRCDQAYALDLEADH